MKLTKASTGPQVPFAIRACGPLYLEAGLSPPSAPEPGPGVKACFRLTCHMSDIDTDTDTSLAESVADAVEAVEDATVEAFKAAVECGDVECAERVSAAVVEQMRRALADIEDAADTVEQIAEEIAEDAPPEAAEAAEDAVEAAHDAQDAVDDAAEDLREEMREQGGGEATENAAEHQAIHEHHEDRRETAPVEDVPGEDIMEEVDHEVADVVDDPPPKLIAPEADHPYYRKRKIRIFGRDMEI